MDNPYVSIYVIGCVCAALAIIIKVLLIYIINWITKDNIVEKNLKKIAFFDEEKKESFFEKYLIKTIITFLEISLSWIGVVLEIGHTIYIIFLNFRELFTSVPEEIKILRFPLKNNPYLSREAVWAYVIALEIKAAAVFHNSNTITNSLQKLKEIYYYSFDQKLALENLVNLNILRPDIISGMQEKIKIDNVFEDISNDYKMHNPIE